MNSTLAIWLKLFGLLALETGVAAGLAHQLSRLAKSAIWRKTIWQICVISLMLLTAGEFTGVSRSLPKWPGKHSRPIAAPAAPAHAKVTAADNAASLQLSDSFHQEVLRRADSRRFEISKTTADESLPIFSQNVTPPAAKLPQENNGTILLFVLAWGLGAAVILSRVFFARLLFEIFRRNRRRIDDPDLNTAIRRLASRLDYRRTVRLLESPALACPVAFGIIRPAIGLPANFMATFSLAQQEAMLAHELAHVAGHDPFWYFITDLLAAALWWHPLVWWVRRRLHRECELAADDASLLVAEGPRTLAECLVQIGSQMSRAGAVSLIGVAAGGYRSSLGRRVERLIGMDGGGWQPAHRGHSLLAKTIGPATLAAATLLCTAWAVPQELNQGENMQTMKQVWQKSLTTFALFSSVAPNTHAAQTKTESAPAPVFATQPSVAAAQRAINIDQAQKAAHSSQREMIQRKLDSIVLEEIQYDSVPLTEVIDKLNHDCRARDPEKTGVNFLLDNTPPNTGGVDRATGLPVVTEPVDWTAVTVKVALPLHNLSVSQLLEVLAKSSSPPVKFAVVDYAVVVSMTGPGLQNRPINSVAESRLEVATFKVNPTNFVNALHSSVVIKGPPAGGGFSRGSAQTGAVEQDLRALLKKLGVSFEQPGEEVVYNDLTGVILLRGTTEDMSLMSAAIETLGGVRYSSSNGNAVTASPSNHQEEVTERQHYLSLKIDAEVSYLREKTALDKLEIETNNAQLRQIILTIKPDELLTGLMQQLNEAQTALRNAQMTYGAQSPDFQKPRRAVSDLEQRVDDRVHGMMEGMRNNVRVLKIQIENIEKHLATAPAPQGE